MWWLEDYAIYTGVYPLLCADAATSTSSGELWSFGSRWPWGSLQLLVIDSFCLWPAGCSTTADADLLFLPGPLIWLAGWLVRRLMAKCGVLENLLLKDHTHTFVNKGEHDCVLAPGISSTWCRRAPALPSPPRDTVTQRRSCCCWPQGPCHPRSPLPMFARWRRAGTGLPFLHWRQQDRRALPRPEGLLHHPPALHA